MTDVVFINRLNELEADIRQLKGVTTDSLTPARPRPKKADTPNPHDVEAFKAACRNRVKPPLTTRQRARLNQQMPLPPEPPPAVDYAAMKQATLKARIEAKCTDATQAAIIANDLAKYAEDGRLLCLSDYPIHRAAISDALRQRNRKIKVSVEGDNRLAGIDLNAQIVIVSSLTFSTIDPAEWPFEAVYVTELTVPCVQFNPALSRLMIPGSDTIPRVIGPGAEGVLASITEFQRDRHGIKNFKHLQQ